jgi:hypothetical protein
VGVNGAIEVMKQQQHQNEDQRESGGMMLRELEEQPDRLCEVKDTEDIIAFTAISLWARKA